MQRDAATSALVSLPRRAPVGFTRAEDGALTGYGLILFLTMMVISAMALDVSRLMSVRSQLQIAADAGAHAALYLQEKYLQDDYSIGAASTKAITEAVDLVRGDMPGSKYGIVVDTTDVSFGNWDSSTHTFTADPTSRKAVEVKARMSEARSNPVQSFLFRLVGYNDFDVGASAVFETFRPTCLTEGFVADGVVDVQSNNLYGGGFCVHSNSYVSLNSNSTFEPGSVVSMPDPNDLDTPASGFDTNDGLTKALRSGAYRLRILDRLDEIMTGLENDDTSVLPDYIIAGTAPIPLDLKNGTATNADFTPGRVHEYECTNSNGTLTINTEPDVPLTDFVLTTNCKVKFGSNAMIEDALVATWSTSDRSITAPSGLIVGRDDSCADGGGGQLLTMGGMEFASDLSLFGAQLMAKKDITFSANASGIEGASIIAGGEISGTSNMAMGYCGGAMDNLYAADYFRLRR